MNRHIYLIGYRGSGKTSVGRILGKLLQMPVLDSDDWLEQHTAKSIRDIFASDGELHFRMLETNAIKTLSRLPVPHVFSLGGGAVVRGENVDMIHQSGWVVWLKASPVQLYSRIHSDHSTADRRPALTTLSGLDEIESLLTFRSPIYASAANLSIETDDRTAADIAEEIYRAYMLASPSWELESESPLAPDTKPPPDDSKAPS